MSRPGVKKVLDPTLASLLAIGDQVTPSVPPALNFLHVALKLAVAEKPPEETLPDSDDSGSESDDPSESVEQSPLWIRKQQEAAAFRKQQEAIDAAARARAASLEQRLAAIESSLPQRDREE